MAGGPHAGDSDPALGAMLDRFPVNAPATSSAGAAVVMVLNSNSHGIETLLIRRADRDGDPASGDVGFPGGHVDASDRHLGETALRELEEEVGLGPEDLGGPLRFVAIENAPRFGLKVGVFASAVSPRGVGRLAPDPREVAATFWLPRSALAHVEPIRRHTSDGWRTVDAVVFGEHVVWGFTLKVLRKYLGEGIPGPEGGP